jgi:hypothetical protein
LKFGESNDAQYHDGGDLQSKQSAINETLKFFCRLMAMQHFAFYAFSECYFFSEVMVGNEGFFFNDNLAPTCNEKGIFRNLNNNNNNFDSISQTYFGRCNLATKSAEKKPCLHLPGPYVVSISNPSSLVLCCLSNF